VLKRETAEKGKTKRLDENKVDGSHPTLQRIHIEIVWSIRKHPDFYEFLAQHSVYLRREICIEGRYSRDNRGCSNRALSRRRERWTPSELASFSVQTSGHSAMTNQIVARMNRVPTRTPVVSLRDVLSGVPLLSHIDKGKCFDGRIDGRRKSEDSVDSRRHYRNIPLGRIRTESSSDHFFAKWKRIILAMGRKKDTRRRLTLQIERFTGNHAGRHKGKHSGSIPSSKHLHA